MARLPDPRDERIYASCSAALDRSVRECGRDVPASDICDKFARVERPEVADWYDCMANATCGEDSGCYPGPDPTLAAHVCDREDVECTEQLRNGLAAATPWLRDDVVAALLDCDSYTTTHRYIACVGTWLDAVFPY